MWRDDSGERLDLSHVSHPARPRPSSYWIDTDDAHVGDVIVKQGTTFWNLPKWMFERDLLPHWREEET